MSKYLVKKGGGFIPKFYINTKVTRSEGESDKKGERMHSRDAYSQKPETRTDLFRVIRPYCTIQPFRCSASAQGFHSQTLFCQQPNDKKTQNSEQTAYKMSDRKYKTTSSQTAVVKQFNNDHDDDPYKSSLNP